MQVREAGLTDDATMTTSSSSSSSRHDLSRPTRSAGKELFSEVPVNQRFADAVSASSVQAAAFENPHADRFPIAPVGKDAGDRRAITLAITVYSQNSRAITRRNH